MISRIEEAQQSSVWVTFRILPEPERQHTFDTPTHDAYLLRRIHRATADELDHLALNVRAQGGLHDADQCHGLAMISAER
jgi:hypothetical protein